MLVLPATGALKAIQDRLGVCFVVVGLPKRLELGYVIKNFFTD